MGQQSTVESEKKYIESKDFGLKLALRMTSPNEYMDLSKLGKMNALIKCTSCIKHKIQTIPFRPCTEDDVIVTQSLKVKEPLDRLLVHHDNPEDYYCIDENFILGWKTRPELYSLNI